MHPANRAFLCAAIGLALAAGPAPAKEAQHGSVHAVRHAGTTTAAAQPAAAPASHAAAPPKTAHVAHAPRVHAARAGAHHQAPRTGTALASGAAPGQATAAAAQSISAASAQPPSSAMAAAPGWNTGWHTDQRFDWVTWRATHTALFRPGLYYPPFGGYAYAPIDVGAVLGAEFLSDRYLIENPAIYHLPPAWGSYRWVRYYNDILLVDIDNGRVVEVIHSLFL